MLWNLLLFFLSFSFLGSLSSSPFVYVCFFFFPFSLQMLFSSFSPLVTTRTTKITTRYSSFSFFDFLSSDIFFSGGKGGRFLSLLFFCSSSSYHGGVSRSRSISFRLFFFFPSTEQPGRGREREGLFLIQILSFYFFPLFSLRNLNPTVLIYPSVCLSTATKSCIFSWERSSINSKECGSMSQATVAFTFTVNSYY